jgi:CRISPR/Cas system-associated exonuclease Cas4 (RecB family)
MSYLGWIAKAFRTDFSTPFAVSKKIRRYSLQSQEVSDEMVSFEVPVISEIDRPESRIQLPPTNLPVSSISILTNTIEAVQGRTRYSPTQLLVFRQCPTKYHLRFNLGIPEDMRLSFEFPPPDNAEYLKGSLVGHLVHKVLQSVDEISSGGTINEDIFTENLRRALEELALDAPTYLPRYKERVLSHFQSFFISDFGKSVLLSKWFYTELPLRIELNGKQLLSGIIDRLYEDEQGFWHILDYKTDRNIEDVEKVERYKFQLRFYAYLVSRLFKIKETLYGHLFFTNFSVVENFEFTEHDLKTVATEMSYYVASILRDKKAVSLSVIERNRSHCPECAYYIAQRNLCLADQ